MQKETARYIRHSLKGTNGSKEVLKENGREKDTKDKDALIPARVATLHNELDILSTEKISLASRLVQLLTRVNARLDHDLNRVMMLSGEHVTEHYEVRGGYVVGVTPVPSGSTTVNIPSANIATGLGRVNAAEKVTESLRAALGTDSISGIAALTPANSGTPAPTTVPNHGPPQKRTCTSLVAVAAYMPG